MDNKQLLRVSALRKIVRHAALSAASMLPARNRKGEIRFLYGHSMTASEVPRFRHTLAMLRDHFDFVSFRTAVDLATGSGPFDERVIAFSFDDGFRDNYELVAPVLDEFGARACFFVATNFIDCDDKYRRDFLTRRAFVNEDRYPMTWKMLRQLHAEGFEVGAHTADHVDLGKCDLSNAITQMSESKRVIEKEIGAACEWFAWPYGLQQHFPSSLLPHAIPMFRMLFSAQRSASLFASRRAVINRDHFEPGWPTAHVRYFVRRSVSPM